jgi:hypothetical protein
VVVVELVVEVEVGDEVLEVEDVVEEVVEVFVVVGDEDVEVVDVIDDEDAEVVVCEEEIVVCEVVGVVDFDVVWLVVSPPPQAEKTRITANNNAAIKPNFLFFIKFLPLLQFIKITLIYCKLNPQTNSKSIAILPN